MADLYRGYDAFWWGEVMGPQTTFDAQRLRIRVDGDIYEAELDDEIYTTTGGTGHADLFSALEQKLTLQIPGAFFWVERTDLTGVDGTIRRGWGTRLRCTQPFSLIRSTSVGSRRLLEILGFDEGVTEFPSVPWSGYYIIDSPRPWGLCWRTPRKADRKLSTIIHEQSTSGGSGQSIQLTRWGTDQIRTFRYSEIPAAHVRAGRASIESYAQVAGLPIGGVSNNFEAFWDGAISNHVPIYAGYDLDTDIDLPDYDEIHAREVLRSPSGSRYADDLSTCLTVAQRAAEFYTVEFALRVESSTWGQG